MASRYQGPEDEQLALDTLVKLTRAADSLADRLTPTTTAAGLTTSQFGVLEALYHTGPLCQRDLGRKLLKSTGNITMVIDNLERDGLVRRERSREDRRYITVHLTEAGRDRIVHLFPAHARRVAEELAILTPEEQTELGRLCRILGKQERED